MVSPPRFAEGRGTSWVTQVGQDTLRASWEGEVPIGFAHRVVEARFAGSLRYPPSGEQFSNECQKNATGGHGTVTKRRRAPKLLNDTT